ncbi:hypothetical protein I302_103268 [Kwoniella bestiolae CBS 10118]|uniref:protein-tyrosine-phosphatase n=1 Tax=Kwoniella bestiolae CBS 10118 TaxID=1296100 RepID=A0A1B9G7Y7_9TREE|nr:hypothetical protein I302_01967 [Kwoniella bestiolae CBS 10118]OCF27132.1 hypothetical protein I302_01967 [Kwoniella bestiolae CBS 10118]
MSPPHPSSSSSPTRPFPNPVAIFNDRFIFTSLTEKQVQAHGRYPYAHPETGRSVLLFSLDEEMHYTPFSKDHGPLNLAFTFQACIRIHDRLERTEAKKKPICMYTTTEPEKKSCMTLIVALYFLIVGRQPPWNAFRPIAPLEIMPFRDAGNGPMDYGLSIQDILYGVDKAMHNGLLDLANFDQESYQKYEQVENGDLNVLGPFIPFASPMEERWLKAIRSSTKTTSTPRGTVRTTVKTVEKARITSNAMRCVMEVFEKEQVGLVVRLNDELYDRRHFLDLGMDHVEMYFDDGSNPSDEIVREFIRLAEHTIEVKGQKVAVHCKAGLGRTGVLIGAYLIYKYQFSAQEVIGFMRIVRPGMVVGPQQHYMLINQMKWSGWAARDQLLRELAAEAAAKEPVNPLATPPTELTNLLPTSSHALQDAESAQNIILQEAAVKLSERKTPTRSSTPTVKVIHKGGDAAGQPRKSPARLNLQNSQHTTSSPGKEELAVILEPASPPIITDDASMDKSDPASDPIMETQSTPEPEVIVPPSSGSMRGTKRAAGRSSIPSFKSSPPRVTLAVPAPTLSRSSSSASMSSISSSDQDHRPPKRRSPTGSPLARNGISSPPPSRESSPVPSSSPLGSDIAGKEERMMVDGEPDPEERPPSTPKTRITNKLRRRVISPSSPSPPVDMPSNTPPPPSVALLPPSETAITALTGLTSPPKAHLPKRSFLPVRKNVSQTQYLDPKTVTLVSTPPVPSTPSRKVEQSNIKSSTPKRLTANAKRSMLTPPRITEMWSQLAKMGSSSPAEAKCEST